MDDSILKLYQIDCSVSHGYFGYLRSFLGYSTSKEMILKRFLQFIKSNGHFYDGNIEDIKITEIKPDPEKFFKLSNTWQTVNEEVLNCG